ncbi:hypothetical protein RB195_018480 [Necator americanus]|uniref:Endonuclease/exonuclease/phosphatase domain-containing protein n=1 Tax=Necator americanus TaxID=51031 RepID=A0ABR1CA00_NECAM
MVLYSRAHVGQRFCHRCPTCALLYNTILSGRLMRTDGPHHPFHVKKESSTPSAHVAGVNPFNEQRKRKMRTVKLQLDYVLTRNIPQSDIRKSRAVWDVAFDSDHRPVLLNFKIRFHKRNRGVPLQPKIDMAGMKDEEWRTEFR